MSDDSSAAEAKASEEPSPEQRARWYAWLREPAVFSDHYSVDLWPSSQIVRFSFGEYIASGVTPNYRVGIAMPAKDARRLLRSLTRIFKQEDERLAKLAQKGQEEVEDEEDEEED